MRAESVAPFASRTLGEAARVARRDQLDRLLQVHDVHVIVLDVLFQRRREFRAFGVRTEMKFSIAIVSSTWPPKRSATTPVADALARRIDRSRRAGRAAADHQHVEGLLVAQLFRGARRGALVDLRQQLLDAHPALGESLAVEEDGRHGHDLARLDLVLEQAAVDGDVADFAD